MCRLRVGIWGRPWERGRWGGGRWRGVVVRMKNWRGSRRLWYLLLLLLLFCYLPTSYLLSYLLCYYISTINSPTNTATGKKKKTLLSLHPTASSRGLQFPHAPPTTPTRPTPWPSPEELLKESLRQSLSALHALGRIKSLVDNHHPEKDVDDSSGEGEKGIAQIMGFYDRAVGEMKAAGEVLVLSPPPRCQPR